MNRFMKKALSLFCVVVLLVPLTMVPSFAMIYGDADGNGQVTPADARRVLRYFLELESVSQELLPYCDLNGDNNITPADSRLILRYTIGLYTETSQTSPSASQQAEQKPAQTKPSKTQYMQNLMNAVNNAEILDNFQIFTEKVGTRWYDSAGADHGRGWICGILNYYGFTESEIVQDQFSCKDAEAYNVYTKITTAVNNPDIILFMAHYDSYYIGAGAVDNASGVCTVLEIARILKSLNRDLGVEVRFLFTSGEEVGYYGAYRYVNHFSPYSLDRHVAIFNVDMSAHFKNSTNHYLTVSTRSSYGSNAKANKASLAVDEAKQLLGSCGEYAYRSPVAAGWHDLIPLEKENLPAITLSWREINYDNSHGSQDGLAAPAEIHTAQDVAANVDMDSLYKTTRLAVGGAAAVLYDYSAG